MRVLYSCLSKSWGGMEMVSLSEIKELTNRGISVELLCINESRIHIEANSLSIIIHPISITGKLHPFAAIKAATLIKAGRYDVIHTHASKDLWVLVPALKIIKSEIPLVMTKHIGSYVVKRDVLHTMLYNRVNNIFAISNAIKTNLLDTLPVKEEKIVLLHNGIDVNKFDPAKGNREKIRNEFGIKDSELCIGMLARFSPGKGHEEFLQSAALLNKVFNNLKFMIIGEASRGEDAYAASIKKMSHDLGIHNIIYTGFRSDTPEVLSSIDIFIFPSHSESFGIALVEAMAMGLPSVCSDTEGVPDIAVDMETSLFFRSKDKDDLTIKIKKLITSPELRVRFAESARKRAVEKFDMNKHINNLLSVYKSLEKE